MKIRELSPNERFKRLEMIHKPDVRMMYSVKEDKFLETLHLELDKLNLIEEVGEDVFLGFETAKNTLLYSFYCYRLSVPCTLFAFSVLEMAITTKALSIEKKFKNTDGLKVKMKYAFNQNFWDIKLLAPETAKPKDWTHYTHNSYIDYYVDMRNRLAHNPAELQGTFDVLELLGDFCKMINMLFENKDTASTQKEI